MFFQEHLQIGHMTLADLAEHPSYTVHGFPFFRFHSPLNIFYDHDIINKYTRVIKVKSDLK